MDSKKVRALFTVIEKGSITAAADELGYTQPGLTNMMNSLESELGLTLLVRGKTGVKLSPDGQELMPSFRRFAAADDELEEYASRIVLRNSSTLKVGAFSSAAQTWLPEVISGFRRLNDHTDVSITAFDNAQAAFAAVKNGTLDCAIVSRFDNLMKGLGWRFLHSDELLAVLPSDYVSDNGGFPIGLFDEEDFLMPSGGFDMDILPALSADGHESKASIRYTNLSDAAIASMVAHRLGYTILSELVMQGIHENVTTLPLQPRAAREMGIIYAEERASDRAILSFLSVAENTVQEIYSKRKIKA